MQHLCVIKIINIRSFIYKLYKELNAPLSNIDDYKTVLFHK